MLEVLRYLVVLSFTVTVFQKSDSEPSTSFFDQPGLDAERTLDSASFSFFPLECFLLFADQGFLTMRDNRWILKENWNSVK